MNDPEEQGSPPLLEARNLVLSVCELKQNGQFPLPRVGGKMVTLGPKCLMHGGFNESSILGKLHLYEIERTVWKDIDSGDAPVVFGHTLSKLGHQLLSFGGGMPGARSDLDILGQGPSHGLSFSNTLAAMDIETSSWTEVEPAEGSEVPSPRVFHADVVIPVEMDDAMHDLLFITGGFDGTQVLDDLFAFEPQTSLWRSVEQRGSLPGPRFGHSLTWVPELEQAVLIGGLWDAELTIFGMRVECCDSGLAVKWSKISARSSPPSSRVFHSTILMRPKWIFLFGGASCDNNYSSYIFDLDRLRWCRPLSDGRFGLRGHAATQLMDKLLVYGGARPIVDKVETSLDQFLTPLKIHELLLDSQMRLSRKLLFCTVLELKGSHQNAQHKFKIVTVGDSAVGKSCLLLRFVTDTYHALHMATIGTDVSSIVTLINGKLCTLQLWDTAGQERFATLSGAYLRDADGFAIVFDLTKRSSFEHILDWVEVIKEHHAMSAQSTAIVLIGNKADLKERCVSNEEATKVANKLGATFVATSAKSAENVDQAFLDLANKLLAIKQRTDKTHFGAASDTLRVGGSAHSGEFGCAGLQQCFMGGR